MRGDIEVGARLPDYELPDQDGVVRRLSDLQGANPMVLHLSRGGFDPKEHRSFTIWSMHTSTFGSGIRAWS
jgi:hypothetical protein